MKYLFTLLTMIVMLAATAVSQTTLVFENATLQDTVRIEAKDYVNIEYKGYLNQTDLQMAFVKSVSASSIYLAASMKTLPAEGYEIKASDITGFRRMSVLQPFIKPVTSLGVVLGTYFILADNKSMSEADLLLYSSIAGLVITYAVDFLFPEDIKYHVADGWSFRFESAKQ
ncbi:MAG: hypothetical protein KA247_03240 [Bacteroidetes bacterium]|nr:hypothetical protein [Bacteroidota bacterium]